MFDIGWTELLLIGVVALIVVGPKDLPGMFQALGRFTAKARGMAREFSRAMEDAASESGVNDISKDLKNMTSARNLGLDAVKGAVDKFEKWDPKMPTSNKKGPATEALSAERAAAADKIRESSAQMASARLAKESAAATAAKAPKKSKKSAAAPAKKPTAAKKPVAAKAPAKTPAKAPVKTAVKPTVKAKAKAPAKKPIVKKTRG